MNVYDLKILLCDDSLLVRKKLKNALIEKGFNKVLEASDGVEAVEISKAEQPDLVLMDIVMPKKDGIEALQEIKQINPDICVIMASSVGTQGNLIKALKMGAYSFLQKPISVEAVEEQLIKISNERRDA
jgi:two-component system, chemotaxis family, chemotaxis protein CheY